MKHILTPILWVLFLCLAETLWSQPNNNYVTSTTIPAPNAGSLGKYADIPVSYFTGVPDISVPIYTVEEGPLKLPVSINYHASGIKVAETASWVGLGWSLNAGGMITRSVQGLPDETFPQGYYHYGSQIQAPQTPGFNLYVANDLTQGNNDTELDLFSFNVGGYTGKFYIDHKDATAQGKPAYRFVPQQDLKLEFLPDFSRFTIIAPDGTRFTFGKVTVNGTVVDAREISHQQNQQASKAYYSSWYLVLVESVDRKFSINLSYADEYYEYKNLSVCNYVTAVDQCGGYAPSSLPISFQCSGNALDQYHYATTMEMTGKRLSSINFSTGAVNFLVNPTANRADLEYGNAKKLESIQITSGTTQIICKQFDFSYDFYQDPANTTLSYYKRLRLTQLQEKSCDGTITIPPHVFNYQGNFLPYRLSKATDHWGYYNGASQNETKEVSIPPTTILNSYTALSESYGSANKESNQTEMLKGVLTDIKYPTNGKTFFTYESNVVQTGVSNTTQKLSLRNCNASPSTCCGTITGTSANVSFATPQSSSTKFNILLSAFPPTSGAPCNPTNIAVIVKAYLSTNPTTPVGTYSFNFSPSPTVQNATTGDLPLTSLATLTANTNYFFTIQATDGYGNLTITETTTTFQNYTVGGLRIKQIRVSETGSSTPVASDIIKDFEYLQEGSSTTSSGVLYKKPVYGFDIIGTSFITGGGSPPSNFGAFHKTFFSESVIEPLFSFEGYHFGYARVKEKLNGNGSKVIKMYTTPEYYNYGNSYPYPPAQPTVSLGKTQYESQYNESNSLIAQSQVLGENFYTTPPTNAGILLKTHTTGYSCINNSNQQSVSVTGIVITSYKNYTNAFKVTSKIDILDGITTTTSYTYDGLSRFLAPTASEVANSNNQVIRTEFTYPHDLPVGCIRDSMLRKNMISDPWKTVVKVNGVQVNGSQKDFAAYNLSTGAFSSASSCVVGTFPRLFQVKNYEVTWDAAGAITTGAWITKGTFNNYNAQGKPASFTVSNWTDPETYTWTTNGLLSSRTFKTHTANYAYYPGTSVLLGITDIDGRKSAFTYDKLNRVIKATQDGANYSISGNTTTITDGNVKTDYTYTYAFPSPGISVVGSKTTYTTVANSTLNVVESKQYVDGLGRPIQTVKKGWAPNLKDVVSAVQYDNQSRIVKQYTPYEGATNSGAFTPIPGTQKFTALTYEASPLNRPLTSTPPDWYATSSTYSTNVANEVGYSDGSSPTSYYPANTLTKSVVTTPQSATVNIETITFKDKKGRLLLSRKKSGANTADTYYIYDNKDRLKTVYPPGVSVASSATQYFAYTYDASDRMITKRVPDINGSINMRYNDRDQLVYVQDPRLSAGFSPDGSATIPSNSWLATQYDDFGRPIKTGITYSSTSPNANVTPTFGEVHSEATYGISGINLGKPTQTKTYIPGLSTAITRDLTYNTITGRLATNNGNNHLTNATGSDNYTYTYDYGGNVLTETRVHKTSPGATALTLVTRNTHDHSGRNTIMYHKIDANAEQQIASNTYDFRDRLLGKGLGWSTQGATSAPIQNLDYAYNEQNWMTAINAPTSFAATQNAIAACSTNPTALNPAEDPFSTSTTSNDLFKLNLYYDAPQTFTSQPVSPVGQRNGNISQMVWQVRGRERQAYNVSYDFLDRMLSATYMDISSAGTANASNRFQENVTYADLRGNIATIQRNGMFKNPASATCWTAGQIDNLTMTYVSGFNRLASVTDAASTANSIQRNTGFNPGTAISTATYTYDNNGNMTNDPYRSMALNYNHLNLPTKFDFGSGKSINIIYDRMGMKLSKTVNDIGAVRLYKQDYVSGLEYRSTGTGSPVLEAIYHNEGRITPNATAWRYEYNIKDHLGSTRLTFADLNGNGVVDITGATSTTEILTENHYYPFGMNMNYDWLNNTGLTADTKYQYNGKEMNDDFGLNWNDYGARWYDASVGRWWSVDLMAEKYSRWSGYNYTMNNPIRFTDPNGMSVSGDYLNSKGKIVGNDGKVNDGKVYVIKTTKKSFTDGQTVPAAGISNDAADEALTFVEKNSGNTEAFEKNSELINKNFVEVVGDPEARTAMINEVSKDNGKGGESDANNREYSGVVDGNTVIANPPGKVSKPTKGAEAPGAPSTETRPTFHSHPSGTLVESEGNGSSSKSTYHQPPSNTDINNAGSTVRYVFARGEAKGGTVYLYNNSGVLATIPMKNFASPK
jgi:RHS repeat-associated protein